MSKRSLGFKIVSAALAVVLVIGCIYIFNFIKDDNSDEKVETSLTVNDLGGDWYEFKGVFTWTETPKERLLDAIAISSSSIINWVLGGDYYFSTFSYTQTNKDKSERVVLTKFFPEGVMDPSTVADTNVLVGSHGMYCRWDLPSDKQGVVYSDFEIVMSARIKIVATDIAFNVFSKYEHLSKYLLKKPKLVWDNATGFAYPSGLLIKTQVYTDYIYFQI